MQFYVTFSPIKELSRYGILYLTSFLSVNQFYSISHSCNGPMIVILKSRDFRNYKSNIIDKPTTSLCLETVKTVIYRISSLLEQQSSFPYLLKGSNLMRGLKSLQLIFLSIQKLIIMLSNPVDYSSVQINSPLSLYTIRQHLNSLVIMLISTTCVISQPKRKASKKKRIWARFFIFFPI